jgi:hypothetical protein
MENFNYDNTQSKCIKKVNMNPILKWIYLKKYKNLNPKTNKINKIRRRRKSSVSHYNIIT